MAERVERGSLQVRRLDHQNSVSSPKNCRLLGEESHWIGCKNSMDRELSCEYLFIHLSSFHVMGGDKGNQIPISGGF